MTVVARVCPEKSGPVYPDCVMASERRAWKRARKKQKEICPLREFVSHHIVQSDWCMVLSLSTSSGDSLLLGGDHGCWCWELGRGDTESIVVSVKHDLLGVSLSAFGGLDPLAVLGGNPDGAEESPDAILHVGAIMPSHDGLDGLGGLLTVVEGHLGEVMVNDVGLNDIVHEVAADETEVTIDGCGGAAGEGPDVTLVVREGGVRVLEVGDPDCQTC